MVYSPFRNLSWVSVSPSICHHVVSALYFEYFSTDFIQNLYESWYWGGVVWDRHTEVTEWKGELCVDLREWKDDKPTKKGISLTLMIWKNRVDYLEYADQARTEKQNYKSHLGGNVYCTITEGSACMDIRQYWKPQEEVVPTKEGLCMRPLEYNAVKELVPEIGRALLELDGVVPCYVQSDHMNQLGALQCSECNPNDHENW